MNKMSRILFCLIIEILMRWKTISRKIGKHDKEKLIVAPPPKNEDKYLDERGYGE